MKKKNILIITIIVLLVILLFPIPMKLKDGGSIEFKALLYSVTKYHKLTPANAEKEYIDGIGIKILGMEIINTTNKYDTEYTEYSSFVGTVLEETTKYMIVEPNEDEEERKSSDKIVVNYGTDHIDYLYGVGRKVIINYSGGIMESYPAQINTDNILINGYEDFTLTVETTVNKGKKKILNNTELYKNNSDYNLYYYGLSKVNITVDNKTMSLEDALRSGKITLDGLITKANKDFPEAISYDDGGSMEYHYENYTIIKLHKLDGNRDVYIGAKDMTIHNTI
ncbi:MAG: DUF3221 domain-containing protein [Clostridia bacterium]